ncbi:hypothetical protein KY284_000569 [Solanum tuberosum]|nr:hypothetical protein KY284_000569 [Solanum tuberosum]
MRWGRPKRAIQRNREEEISHCIARSSVGNVVQMKEEIGVTEAHMNTPEGGPHMVAVNTGKEQ